MKRASSTSMIIAALIITALVVAGCAQTPPDRTGTGSVSVKGTYAPPEPFNPDEELQAQTFGSEEELQAFIRDNNAGGGYYGGILVERSAVAQEAADSAGGIAKATAAPAPSGFSQTNNQVAGVDEADIIKTDGSYIYTISGNTLFIVKAYPGAEAEVIKTVEFEQTPQGLFIDGDRLAVFGSFYDLDYFKRIGVVPQSGMTYFNLYDISDRASPQLLEEYKFEGNYFQARMTGGYVYFVVTSGAESRDNPTPIILEGDEVRNVAVSDVYFYPVPYDSVQYATVHAISMRDTSDSIDSTAVMVEWDNKLYMSEQNIYIATTEQINEWEISQQVTMELLEGQLTEADRQRIERIKATDDDILSRSEKEAKIYEVYQRYVQYMNTTEQQDFQDRLEAEVKERLEAYESLTYTIVNRISAQNGELAVRGTGKVPGQLNNQFAMDEHNGVLRLATTTRQSWWWGNPRPMPVDIAVVEPAAAEPGVAAEAIAPDEPARKIMPPRENRESANHVYTLDADMNIQGRLTDLAEGEQIYSTRFMGDRLYMVTFRQVDPFFVIDLSDPARPRELGELKIPGFSRYLHPYDENTIIGIGRDASDTGRQRGLKISLFDVSDVANPREVAKFVGDDENAQSTAEWEHKAFLFDREKELLVIPAYSYSYDYRSGASKEQYNGALVFKVARSEVSMRGIVDHSQGNNQYWGPSVERSLWIEDLLYTKSPQLLRINRIDTLAAVKNVTLTPSGSSGPYPVY